MGENIKKSYIKRNRGINICNLFITDQIKKGGLNIEYCPNAEMITYFMSKPLQRKIFQKYRALIMGQLFFPYYVWQQEYVGRFPTWKIIINMGNLLYTGNVLLKMIKHERYKRNRLWLVIYMISRSQEITLLEITSMVNKWI